MSANIFPGEYITGYKVKRANNFLLTATKESEKVIKEADILYSQNQLDDLYEFLKQYEDVESGQICWRLARYAKAYLIASTNALTFQKLMNAAR